MYKQNNKLSINIPTLPIKVIEDFNVTPENQIKKDKTYPPPIKKKLKVKYVGIF